MVEQRKNQGKLRVDLIPPEQIVELARAFTAGAAKYGPSNWLESPVKFSTNLASLGRHLLKLKLGEDFDEETGCRHAALVAWNALAILSYQLRGLDKEYDLDDRLSLDTYDDMLEIK